MNCAKEPLANKSFVIETVIVEVISDALIKFVTSSSVTEIQTALKDTNAKIKCVYHPVMIPKIVPKITFVTTPIASLSYVNVTQIAMVAQGRVNVKKIDAFFLVLANLHMSVIGETVSYHLVAYVTKVLNVWQTVKMDNVVDVKPSK